MLMTKEFTKANMRTRIIRDLAEHLQSDYQNNLCTYELLGTEHATNYKGELLYEDEEKTIPKMRDVYGFVQKPVESLSEEDKLLDEAYQSVLKDLEKLIR